MRGLLRWIIIIALFILVVFLFINLYNRGKNSGAKKNNDVSPPVVIEKGNSDSSIDQYEEDDYLETEPVITEETIEVGDTAGFNTFGVFVGVFTIASGIFFIRKKANQ